MKPILVAARSKAWAYGRLVAGTAGSNPAPDRGCLSPSVCDGPITRPEESYQVCLCRSDCMISELDVTPHVRYTARYT